MMKRAGALVAALVLVGSGCASTGGSVDGSSPEGSNSGEGSSSGGGDEQAADPAFGQTFTWDNGLSVTISKPKPFKPTAYAAFDKAPQYRLFDVTVVNKTGDRVDLSTTYVTVQSRDREMGEVFDTDAKLDGSPSTPLLDGRQAKWKIGFGIQDPKDIVMQFDPGVYEPELLEPVIFVQQGNG